MGTESECGGFTLRTLVETIVWCESNPGGDLRREATRPTSQFAAKNRAQSDRHRTCAGC